MSLELLFVELELLMLNGSSFLFLADNLLGILLHL